jgi:RHS repeat-associated protein
MRIYPLLSKIMLASLLTLFSDTSFAGAKFTYYVNDALGSPVVAMNQAGDVVWRKTYQPYGKASGKDGDNRIGYTGHVEDQPDLVYAGARYYDPALGRFLSDDPARFTEKNPMSFNRYAYANNNPYKFVDPDGREIVPSGDVQYDKRINSMLDRISASNPDLGAMISDLRNSKNPHQIIGLTEGVSTGVIPLHGTDEVDNPRPYDGSGDGSTINFDEYISEVKEEGRRFFTSSEAVLAHELQHASDIDKGISKRVNDGGLGVGFSKNENKAIGTENKYRSGVGESPLRKEFH